MPKPEHIHFNCFLICISDLIFFIAAAVASGSRRHESCSAFDGGESYRNLEHRMYRGDGFVFTGCRSLIAPTAGCVSRTRVGEDDGFGWTGGAGTHRRSSAPSMTSSLVYVLPPRVERYAGCSSQCYIIALVYVDTIIQRKKSFVISSLNIHRLLITR